MTNHNFFRNYKIKNKIYMVTCPELTFMQTFLLILIFLIPVTPFS